jgi:hypothetical protein
VKNFLISYFLFCWFFFSFFASGFLDSQDGLQYLAIARRIYYDQTVEMPTESFLNGKNIHMNVTKANEGKFYAVTGLGFSLAYLPAVFLEDVFLHLANLEPISAFPLENDWPVLLFASMANAFFASFLVIIFYLYLRALEIKHKQALFLSFLIFIASNLFPYAKHSFAHMMFVSFLTSTFYLIKRYSQTKNSFYMLGASISFGIVVISYNPTFTFAIPALIFYYFSLSNFKISLNYFKKLFINIFYGLSGFLPFLLAYVIFNNLRTSKGGIKQIANIAESTISRVPPAYVIVEGIWGLLFSAGKSIFLFSPLLLILVLFWFKLNKKLLPEIGAALILFFTYLWLIGTYLGGPNFLVWHGDSSWGPRYLLAVLPLLLILVAHIYTKLDLKQKLFVFLPLVVLGLGINLLGILLPYQIRYRYLPYDTWIGSTQFKASDYGNFIPRYSPVFNMSKIFAKRTINLKRNWRKNVYNIRLSDGFDQPFDLGSSVWRGMRTTSIITFDNFPKKPIQNLSLQIKNHQINSSSIQSAYFKFYLNDRKIEAIENQASLAINQEQRFKFDLADADLQIKNNILTIDSRFEGVAPAFLDKKQALFLQILRVNNLPQNIERINYPYVSPISQRLFDIEYDYWGNIEKDPWAIWHMHSVVYENSFDLWWLRPFYYWDLPKDFFGGLFVINLGGILYYGFRTWKFADKE